MLQLHGTGTPSGWMGGQRVCTIPPLLASGERQGLGPGAGLLAQALGLVELDDELGGVGALGKGGEEVLAHVQAHVRAHQIAQPAARNVHASDIAVPQPQDGTGASAGHAALRNALKQTDRALDWRDSLLSKEPDVRLQSACISAAPSTANGRRVIMFCTRYCITTYSSCSGGWQCEQDAHS